MGKEKTLAINFANVHCTVYFVLIHLFLLEIELGYLTIMTILITLQNVQNV